MSRQTFTSGQILTAAQCTQLQDAIWSDDVNAQTGTTYTLLLTDAGKQVTMTNSAASVLTIPPNSSVAFVVGVRIQVIQLGAGAVTITAGSGVTAQTSYQSLAMTRYSVVTLIKTATDTWVIENLDTKVTTTNALTDSYTLVLADASKLVEIGKATAVNLTVPTNTTVAFPVGTTIDVLQTLAGQITIVPVDGTVTVNATPGLKLRAQWSSATLIKRATNTWVLVGDLSA